MHANSAWTRSALLLVILSVHVHLDAQAASSIKRVAILGGGIGGTAAAHFLRQLQPSWQLELFERERIGGRTQELLYDAKTLELGASIIHAQNQYVLSLAKAINLTATKRDDTGAAFSIYDGSSFVFSQTGSQIKDVLAVLKRYGVSPLRYKWLAEEMGRRFGGIYDLQQRGRAFRTPRELLEALGLYNVTQQSAAGYMQGHLTAGLWRYGSGRFIAELAGAVNRINYNQANEGLNGMAGLVSYLPAAQPQVYSIKEGNAALPRKLAAASDLQAAHVGVAVQAIQQEADGRYNLLAVQKGISLSSTGNQQQQEQQVKFGPFDGVVLATPLEGSGIELQGFKLNPDASAYAAALPNRTYQTTVTSYVTGALNPAYFKVTALPAGDVFVTNSANTPFSVIANKGTVSVAAAAAVATEQGAEAAAAAHQQTAAGRASRAPGSCTDSEKRHEQQQQQTQTYQQGQTQQQGQVQQQEQPLWKVFSQAPLSEVLLQQLFINGSVIISKAWKAYPRFHPPEEFAPFLLGPGLCYNNALENAASAMEVSAVAAMNCALLLQQQLGGSVDGSVATS